MTLQSLIIRHLPLSLWMREHGLSNKGYNALAIYFTTGGMLMILYHQQGGMLKL